MPSYAKAMIRTGGSRLSVLLGAALLTVGAVDAEEVYLKASDLDTWKDGTVTKANMSSFLTNHADYTKGDVTLSDYGWSDGNDPSPDVDYKVASGCTLRTPFAADLDAATVADTVYTFPGKSLTLDNGTIAHRSCSDGGTAEVRIPNLIVRKGTLANNMWSRNNRWAGRSRWTHPPKTIPKGR